MHRWTVLIIAVALVAAACSSTSDDSLQDSQSAESSADSTLPECDPLESGCGGGSEETVPAASVVPIMGFEWLMDATLVVDLEGGRKLTSTALLTLEFEDGQDANESTPRYVVTGGTVTYGDRSGSALGCTYSGGGLTFDVTPDMSPANPAGESAPSVLIFDTTVSPVEYRGVIYTRGPDDTVEQDCTDIDPDAYGVNTVSYGGNKTWMIVDEGDHLTVMNGELIEATLQRASSVVYEFMITRTN